MKLFLDLSPAASLDQHPAAWLAAGLAEAALATASEDVYFAVGGRLFPRAFVAWATGEDWETEAPTRRLSAGDVQFGRQDRARAKHAVETCVAVAVEPLAPTRDALDRRGFDVSVAILGDPSALLTPERVGARAEGAAASLARLAAFDLVICASETAWRATVAAFAGRPAPTILAIPAGPPGRSPGPREHDGATRDYVVLVAEAAPRDDLDGVFMAWEAATRERTPLAPGLEGGLRVLTPGAASPSPPEGVTVRPYVSAPAARETIARARGVIAPALGEPSGRWAREAERLGVPALSAIGGGAEEFSASPTAFRYDPADIAGAAEAVARFLRETEPALWPAARRDALARAAATPSWTVAGGAMLDAIRRFVRGAL